MNKYCFEVRGDNQVLVCNVHPSEMKNYIHGGVLDVTPLIKPCKNGPPKIVGPFCFYYLPDMVVLKLPSTVEVLDKFSFFLCANLTGIENCGNLKKISVDAFSENLYSRGAIDKTQIKLKYLNESNLKIPSIVKKYVNLQCKNEKELIEKLEKAVPIHTLNQDEVPWNSNVTTLCESERTVLKGFYGLEKCYPNWKDLQNLLKNGIFLSKD